MEEINYIPEDKSAHQDNSFNVNHKQKRHGQQEMHVEDVKNLKQSVGEKLLISKDKYLYMKQ